MSTRPSKTLDYNYEFYVSFELELPVGRQAHRFRLPMSMKIQERGEEEQPLAIEVEGEDEGEVDEILGTRRH